MKENVPGFPTDSFKRTCGSWSHSCELEPQTGCGDYLISLKNKKRKCKDWEISNITSNIYKGDYSESRTNEWETFL